MKEINKNMDRNLIEEKMKRIYKDRSKQEYATSLLMDCLSKLHPLKRKEGLSQKDSVLITYADSIVSKTSKPLSTLSRFLNTFVKDSIDTIHILPFFPYSSDDGFSVIDYDKVNPEFGSWDDINNIAKNYGLMIDSVANHVSKSSRWFELYLEGVKPYTDYFISSDPNADYSSVTRPRMLPLLTKFETKEGEKYLWTTFSSDQIDLNYRCPELLVEIINSILNYAHHGARFIRLDAIGFIWKELGTSCMHLEECHEIIKLIRLVLDEYAPGVMLITETNVPQKDNISYFGNGDEAMMVYQFPLPPLVMFTLISGRSRRLLNWLESLYKPKGKETYFNFLSSHDGIGLRPVDGILSEDEKNLLVKNCLANGGRVSYKDNGDGTKSPYEMNIVYYDALLLPNDSKEIAKKKFIASIAILLSLQGVPAIYIHSLLGSRNDYEGMEKSGIARRINRKKLDYDKISSELNSNTPRKHIFDSITKLLDIRKEHTAFSPYSKEKVLHYDDRVFSIERTNEEESIIALINVSNNKYCLNDVSLSGFDLITNKSINGKVLIEPYQSIWLKRSF